MERIRTLTLYRWECDGCGCWGPEGYSRQEAKEAAREEGWVVTEFWNGLEWVIRHYCPDCAAEQGIRRA